MLPLCARGSPIPSGYDLCPPWAKVGDSDAAGGSVHAAGKGLGVVVGQSWIYLPWPRLFNSMAKASCCGKFWKNKLTFLELNGAMARLCGFPEDCIDSSVSTHIDNRGSVYVSGKGYDLRCPTTNTLVKATWDVATALNCRSYVKNIRRCSTVGAIAADALSKADFQTFDKLIPGHELEPNKLPKSYVKWLQNPVPDPNLGDKIIADLRSNGVKIMSFIK